MHLQENVLNYFSANFHCWLNSWDPLKKLSFESYSDSNIVDYF